MTTRHTIVNPESLAPAVGFAHAVIAAPGRTVYLGGQTGHDGDGQLPGASLVEQFAGACANVVTALNGAGAGAEDVVSMHVYTTRAAEYRANLRELGRIYQSHFGRHYPAMALFGVTELFDPDAVVELVCVAAVPD